MEVPRDITNCLLYTTLTLNSATLFVDEKPELIAHHGLQDLADTVASQMSSINTSKPQFGTIPLSIGNKFLSLYYVKYILPTNDIVTIITVFSEDVPKYLPVTVLDTIMREYKAHRAQTSSNVEFKVKFNQIIKHHETEYARSAINVAGRELEQVKGVLNDNIEQVLERNERINLLVNKTDRITSLSNSFRANTVRVKRKMWWQNVKFWVVFGVVVGVLCVVIFKIVIG